MMQVWKTTSCWLDRRRVLTGQTIGFVPTMGALHRGHASLVERCRAENQIAVASIFVNPSQFNDAKDLERYPQTLDRDLALLESLGVDDVLAPLDSPARSRSHEGDCRKKNPAWVKPRSSLSSRFTKREASNPFGLRRLSSATSHCSFQHGDRCSLEHLLVCRN